jgi:hypothetical protein
MKFFESAEMCHSLLASCQMNNLLNGATQRLPHLYSKASFQKMPFQKIIFMYLIIDFAGWHDLVRFVINMLFHF